MTDNVGAMPTARAATPSGLSRFASSCLHRIAIAKRRLRSLLNGRNDDSLITPEWCLNMAKLEVGHEVGAGAAGLDPTSDCPHAAPFRYCETCKVSPCPIGLSAGKPA